MLEDTDLKFVILSLLLRELKKGETFVSLLNIHGGDIRVVPTHLVLNSYILHVHVHCIFITVKHTIKRVRVIVFNTICSNISVILWQSVLLVEEPRVSGENR
jgi:energy-converting hydrogenase Eha subunit E